LKEFGIFCALAEQFNYGWRKWLAKFQNPDSLAVKKFAGENLNKVRFHQWLQWLLDLQLTRAAKELPLMLDLPVGVDPSGADAWAWQNILACDMTVGAPPDEYNTQGQNWGLPPFAPQKLRAAGYEPFRQTIRAALRHAKGLRIDHVMGLFRLFWIPKNAPPQNGAYVRYRADELLAIIALESQRAKAVIVGEDLGTVEPGVRAELRRRKMLSYRLLWFESKPVAKFPKQSLAAVTTHDLFTIAGLWNGGDLAAQKKLGLHPNEKGMEKILRKLQKNIGLKPGDSVQEAILRTHELLSESPSMLRTTSLEDALAVEERPNMPGTTMQWPNWKIALPASFEAIRRNSLVKKISGAFAKGKK
ncbi:MAG: 4-alpha-glucanotransferase, partial [Limisphaerales bacterium]